MKQIPTDETPRLLQDEAEGYETQRLSKWFASRIDARETIRRNFMQTTHPDDFRVTPFTSPEHNAIHEAVQFYWGERCPEHEEGCPACGAWKQYDQLIQGELK